MYIRSYIIEKRVLNLCISLKKEYIPYVYPFLLLLGDFNARVGVLGSDEEQCQGIMGKHGLDDRNEAGEVTVLCIESVDSYEYLVRKEECLLWHLGTPGYQTVAHD